MREGKTANASRPQGPDARTWELSFRALRSAMGSAALLLGLGLAAATAAPAVAPVLPQGGAFIAGQGQIGAPNAGALTINQQSAKGVIDWNSFSIGAGGAVNINNGAGATLNRVTGGQMSDIAGRLTSTGSVYLVNPQGVVVSSTGQVLGGGSVVLSSRDIPTAGFMSGATVTASGNTAGDVTNAGSVVSKQGNVVLIGRSVSNSGELSAANGSVSLNAANSVLMSDGASSIYVAPDASATGDVSQEGQIAAAAASLTAAGGNVYALAGNRGGLIQATGTTSVDGEVWLTAPNGDVSVAGKIVARNLDGSGGKIVAAGANATTLTGALDASGIRGGLVLVGVTAPQTNLSGMTTIASGSTILAGGAQGSGQVETSGHTLNVGLATLNTHNGSWLLDPTDVTIDAAAASTISTALASSSVSIQTTSSATVTTSGVPSSIGVQSGTAGNINVNSAITWSNAASALTLKSDTGAINVNAAITGAGDLNLQAANAVNIGATAISVRQANIASQFSSVQVAGGGSITGSAGVLIKDGAVFINNGTVSSSGGRVLVYSQNPNNDAAGNLVSGSTFVQYGATFATTDFTTQTAPATTGNGLIYTITPTLAYSVTGTISKTYDGNNLATLTASNLTATGLVTGDTITTVGGANNATFSQSDVGDSLTVTLNTNPLVSRSGMVVYGYAAGQQRNLGVIGSITKAPVTVSTSATFTKIYDGNVDVNDGSSSVPLNTTTLNPANFTIGGVVSGQSITLGVPFKATYDNGPDVGTNLPVTISLSGTSFVAGSGTKLTNYDLPFYVNGSAGAVTGTITKAPLHVVGVGASDKVYNGTNVAGLTFTSAALDSSDLIAADSSNVTLNTGSASGVFHAGANAGTGLQVDVSGLSITGSKAGNYQLIAPTTVKASITKAGATLSGVTVDTKVYDGSTTATLNIGGATVVGLVSGDGSSINLNNLGGSAFANANAGSNISVTAAGLTLTGSVSGNYTLTLPTTLSGTIQPKQLSVTVNGPFVKTYDGTATAAVAPSALTFGGWVGSDGATLNAVTGVFQTAGVANANAGAKTVLITLQQSDLQATGSTVLTNYTFDAPSSPQNLFKTVSGTGTINKAPLTITVVGNPTKTFDGGSAATLTSANYLVSGFVGSEGATINQTAGTYGDPNAGVQTVSATLADGNFSMTGGALLSNYSYTSPVSGFGTINKAGLHIRTILNTTKDKTFDGNTNVTATINYGGVGSWGDFVLDGWTGGDTGSDVFLNSAKLVTALYASKNAGTQPITITVDATRNGVSTTDFGFYQSSTTNLNNYNLPTFINGSGVISPKPISVSITGNPTKVYNGTTQATLATGDYTITGLVSGDSMSVIKALGAYASANATSAGGATVNVNLDAASFLENNTGTLRTNYTLGVLGTSTLVKTITGSGTINKAPLTIGGVSATGKVYDGTNAAGAVTIASGSAFLNGLVNGESLNFTFKPTTGTFASPDANAAQVVNYTSFTLSDGTGLVANYALTQPSITAAITPKLITANFSATSRAYDGTTNASVSSTGLNSLFAGDAGNVSVANGFTAVFRDPNAASGVKIDIGGLTLTGSRASNYKIDPSAITSADITKVALSGSIVGTPSRIYNGLFSVVLNSGDFSLTGFVNGEGGDVTIVNPASANYTNQHVGTGITINTTEVRSSYASSTTNLGNYVLPTNIDCNCGVITKAPLIAQIINNPTKIYDGNTNTSSTTANLASSNYKLLGFVLSEGATVAPNLAGTYNLSGTTTADRHAGIKTISAALVAGNFTANAGTDLNDYTLPTIALGGGTINPKSLSASMTGDPTKVYDGNTTATGMTPGFYNITGFITGEGGDVTITKTTGTYALKDVGARGVTVDLGGGDFATGATTTLTDYVLPTQALGTGHITQKGVYVTVTKLYDGTNSISGATLAVVGAVNGETLGATVTGGAYNDRSSGTPIPNVNVGDYQGVDLTGISLTGTGASNYVVQTPFTNVNTTSYSGEYVGFIQKRPLTIGLAFQTKVYDTTTAVTPALTPSSYTIGGLQNGETLSITQTVGTYDNANVGNASKTVTAVIGGNYTGGAGFLASNYDIPANALNTVSTITPAGLTIDLTRVTKVYDGTTALPGVSSAYTLTGIQGTDDVSVGSASGSYDNANVGSAHKITLTGPGITLAGAQAGNYTVNALSPTNTIGIITKAPLTITVSNTKLYDGLLAATLGTGDFNIVGLKNGETVQINQTAGTFSNKNVATVGKTVSASLADGNFVNGSTFFNIGNYSYTVVAGAGTINVRPLGLSIVGGPNKLYDATTTATLTSGNYAFTGLQNGETATINATTGAYNSKDVSTATTVTVSGLTSANYVGANGFVASNYQLAASASGPGTISARTLTAALNAQTKIYDGNANALGLTTGSYQITGLQGGETLVINRTSGTYNSPNVVGATTATVASLVSGDFTGGAGFLSGNYVLPTSASGAGTITPKTLTVAVNAPQTKVYDATTTAAGLTASNYTITGLVGSETATIGATSGSYNSKDVATATTVSVALTSGSYTGANGFIASNYSLASTASGSGTITKRPLTLAIIGGPTKLYDGTTLANLVAGNYGFTGLQGGETASITGATGNYNSKDVLTANTVSVTGLTSANYTGGNGFLAGNYTLASSATGAGTITPRTLTAALSAHTKVYDANTTVLPAVTPGEYTVTGLQNGETLAINQTVANYDNANVGNGNKTVTALLTSGNFTGGNGFLNSNYVLPTQALNLVSSITPATLNLTIDLTHVVKVYDGTTTLPTLSSAYTLAGVVSGDQVTVAGATGNYLSPNVGNGIAMNITSVTLGGAQGANYVVNPVPAGALIGEITPLTLTASIINNPTKIYDGTTVALLTRGNFSLVGFVGSEGASVTQTAGTYASANAGSPVGVSATLAPGDFTANTGTLLSNYILPVLAQGPGTISPRPITASIVNNPTKVYDGTSTALLGPTNFSLIGFVAGDGASVTQTAGLYASPNAGSPVGVTATLAPGDFAANSGTVFSNYVLPVIAQGPGTITPRPVTAAIVGNPTKDFDGSTNATLTPVNYTLTGLVGGQTLTVTQTAGTYDDPNAGDRNVSAVLNPGFFTPGTGVLLGNYALPTIATGPGHINVRNLIVQTGAPSVFSQYTAVLADQGVTLADAAPVQRVVRQVILTMATPRIYIPFPAEGALSTWKGNGFGSLPIVVDQTTNAAVVVSDDGNVATQSGPPMINNTEQVLLTGVRNKQYRIIITSQAANGPTLASQ